MIYIHVPFCRSFCTYCDFYSEIACRGRDEGAVENYTSLLCREIQSRRSELEATLGLNTLYIGGGTPSVLPSACLERILSCLPYGPWEEFTIEVNPEDIVEKGVEYVRELVRLGVNRVSMGVQSLDDGILRWMNRRHDACGAGKAFSILREGGIANISVDLIFGVPEMDIPMLESTIGQILSWGPEHISAYQLSIEEGSALAEMIEKGRCRELPEEECRKQYDYLCRALSSAGYNHYEISNWALPGFEARHNSAYWKRLPYIGLGPGAHSLKVRDCRSWNSRESRGWSQECEYLSEEEIREERLMLGLRTSEGVDGRRIDEKDWFISDSIISSILAES